MDTALKTRETDKTALFEVLLLNNADDQNREIEKAEQANLHTTNELQNNDSDSKTKPTRKSHTQKCNLKPNIIQPKTLVFHQQ